ncbi:MAG TPA: cystathionine gamma-lyase [Mycobacterium sp.]|nr:cystathionine gamma-lyase [Mycobacterium sp.]
MSVSPGRFGSSTRTVKAIGTQAIAGQPVSPGMVPATTFHLGDPADGLDFYGRSSNPTWRQVEAALAQLEGAATAMVFGSGMAAITATLRVLAKPGAVLVVPADGYYQVRAYASEYLAPLGVTVREASATQMCEAAEGADVVLAETPANPALDVTDLHRLAQICRSAGTRLVVDNTTATPLGQVPLSLGADLVVASATKALSGHSDLLAGYVAGSQPELMDAIARERLLAGPVLGTFEAWLLLRSLGSAGLRFERQCRNAQLLAGALQGHSAVRSVRYPGLPGDPAHQVAAAQMIRFGGLVSIELADAAAVEALVARSELLVASTSFGGIHTSVDRRARWGDAVSPGFARISLGIEDTDDLIADFEQALS